MRLPLLASVAIAAGCLFCAPPTSAATVTPSGGTASTVAVGGTAVTAITGPTNGCYIFNPLSVADEGIMTAEPLYVDPTTTATTTGNGTNTAIAPGQGWYCIPYSTKNVSANAATTGHAFVVVRW